MIGFPLLLIPLAIYNIFVFLMPSVVLTAPAATITLPSGAGWVLTFGDAIAIVGLFLLFIEVVKASRPGARSLMDHLLSFVAFVVAAAEFAWLPQFATSAFFLLTAMVLVEFLAGAAFSLRRGRGAGSRGRPPAVPSEIAEPAASASPVVPAPVVAARPDAGAKPPETTP